MNPNFSVQCNFTYLFFYVHECRQDKCGDFPLTNLLFQYTMLLYIFITPLLKSNKIFLSFFVFVSPPEFISLLTISKLLIIRKTKIPLLNLHSSRIKMKELMSKINISCSYAELKYDFTVFHFTFDKYD